MYKPSPSIRIFLLRLTGMACLFGTVSVLYSLIRFSTFNTNSFTLALCSLLSALCSLYLFFHYHQSSRKPTSP